jgi:hypothetical protein
MFAWSEGSRERHPTKMEPIASPAMCSYGEGSIRAASGTTQGVSGTGKLKENKRFYGFTDFRGKPARRGRGSHAPLNQVTAGSVCECNTQRNSHREKDVRSIAHVPYPGTDREAGGPRAGRGSFIIIYC